MDSQLRALFRRVTSQFDMETYRLYTNQLLRSGSGNIAEWLQYLVPIYPIEWARTDTTVVRRGYLLRVGAKSFRESSQFIFCDSTTFLLYSVQFTQPGYFYELPTLERDPRTAIERNRQLDLDQIHFVLHQNLFSISATPINYMEILGYLPLGFAKIGVQVWEQCVGPLGLHPTVDDVARTKNASKLMTTAIPVEAWLPLLLEDSYEYLSKLLAELNRDLNSDVIVTNEGYRIAVVDRKTGKQILEPLVEHIQMDNLLRASGVAKTGGLYRQLSGNYQITITRETLYEFLTVNIQGLEQKIAICGYSMPPRRYWLPAYLPPVEEEENNWAPWPLMNWPIQQVLRMLGRLAEYEDTPSDTEMATIGRHILRQVNSILPRIAAETYTPDDEPIPESYNHPLTRVVLWSEVDEGMEHGNFYRHTWLYARASNDYGLEIDFDGAGLARKEVVNDHWRWFQHLERTYQIYETKYWRDIA